MTTQTPKWTATAEHTSGQSVGHPCLRGGYDDPTDHFQVEVVGDANCTATGAADVAARAALEAVVDGAKPCDCQRREQPGSDRWWNSVAITLWPINRAAADMFVTQGGDLANDPYGLIPADLKADVAV